MAEYIEREALRERMESVDWYHAGESGVLVHGATSDMESYLPTKEVYRAICEAPAADVVEVKHGRWEFDGSDFADIWKCSACGEDWYFEYDPRDAETPVKFCPNCGARMDGE